MKKLALCLVILLVAFAVFQGPAFAKLVSGKVSAVDTAANVIEIARMNPTTNAEEKVKVGVDDKTTYAGVANVSEIKGGEYVMVMADQDSATGNWKASSVRVSKI
ncbi:MAG: hypothetical protein PHN49_04440 [Candidatus Omnitrophica bacterium]|nr:hypothetical protein [Candidatus Omnitrophota bacterium]MDD5670871.1 hypothetical protein [Candidatus Omnitrophota bacterium]